MKTPYLILLFLTLDIACFAQPMSGTYAVGGPQGDFATPALAVQQLQQRGMNGPVILKIHPGTYWGQFFINNISGSSMQNKLTIESESGNNNDVILTYNMQDYSSAYLIWIGDIKNLEINNITFEPTGSFSISLKSYGLVSTLEVYGCVFRSCTCNENIAEASIIGGVADTLILRNNTFIGCKPLKISSHYTIINNNFFIKVSMK